MPARPSHPRLEWHSDEGVYRVAGRWNSWVVRLVYCSIDPATTIFKVSVHKGFHALDSLSLAEEILMAS